MEKGATGHKINTFFLKNAKKRFCTRKHQALPTLSAEHAFRTGNDHLQKGNGKKLLYAHT
ncbi:MAG: hypothetical protein J6M19_01675 [Bacteroidaceae bacterium]|nr:hypothetical protein [Bacteroidaceae bacterium]